MPRTDCNGGDDVPTRAFSDLYATEKSIPELFRVSRKQAGQIQATTIALGGTRAKIDAVERDVSNLEESVDSEVSRLDGRIDATNDRVEQKTQILADVGVRLEHRIVEINTRLAVGWGATIAGCGLFAFLAMFLAQWLMKK